VYTAIFIDTPFWKDSEAISAYHPFMQSNILRAFPPNRHFHTFHSSIATAKLSRNALWYCCRHSNSWDTIDYSSYRHLRSATYHLFLLDIAFWVSWNRNIADSIHGWGVSACRSCAHIVILIRHSSPVLSIPRSQWPYFKQSWSQINYSSCFVQLLCYYYC